MANEILHVHATGKTLYGLLFNSARQVWNGSAFATFAAGSWSSYAVTITESGGGVYLGSLPTIAAGLYDVKVFERQGGSPASTDFLVGEYRFEWSGTAEVRPASATEIDTTLTASHGSGLWQSGATVAPSMCRVYGYELSGTGTPVSGRTVRATLAAPPQTTATAIIEAEPATVRSGPDGYWYLDLVQGKGYRLQIPEAGVDKTLSVPAQSSLDLRTYL